MIRVIEIEHIKGIQSKRFAMDITPNRPSLLVAPNGFGKSSLATAFSSMNNRRIDLDEDDLYAENIANLPRIYVEYVRPDGTVATLEATNGTNTISSELGYFVVNNQTKPKGNASTFGGFGNARASLIIEDVVLVDRIPDNTSFNYSFRDSQVRFGVCSRVLPNSNAVLANLLLVEQLSENYLALQRGNGGRLQVRINAIIADINAQQGTAPVLLDWITANRLADLKQIDYLNTIGDLIHSFDIG